MIAALVLALEIDVARLCADATDARVPAAAAALEKECETDAEVLCRARMAEKLANGEGVPRNYDAARWALCMAADELAPAELEGMFAHLERMRADLDDRPLKFCNNATSGYGASYCASVHRDEVMPILEARLRKLALPAPLLDAANAFVEAETERVGELSRGGTGYSALTIEAELDAKQQVVNALESASKRRAPAATNIAERDADGALNAMYRQAQADLADYEHAGELQTLLRDAQRAWIKYRDAFVKYYVARWRGTAPPDVLRREILAQLARDRTKALEQ